MKASTYIPEGYMPGGLESLNSNQLEKIMFQMKNCICKIENGKRKGTGFFCKIPFPDTLNLLPVLITCNHVLDKNNISQGKKINFSLNNEPEPYSITINSSRKTFTNEEKDVTIIEIYPQKDNIKVNSFLDIDEEIDKKDLNKIYKDKSIYIIHYEKGNEARCSLGKILEIGKDQYDIEHNCSTQGGSSGSPIINLNLFKVVGVHLGYDEKNFGILLKNPIVEFIQKFKESNENIMSVIVKDENQKLYSLICKKTDKFSSLEIELFKKQPSLKNQKHYYIINDKKIDISKTIEENNITDGSVIYYKMQEINNEDDEISVIIKSSDQAIKSSFICQKRDKFKVLQQKLYEKYPNLKKKEHYYICWGNLIDIEKTIEENRIKDNDMIIIFNEIEEDEGINVNITTSDQSINVSIKCQKSDNFKVLEDKLYEKYPNLKFKNHYYLYNGNFINIEKTIEENKIKDNAYILYNISENEEKEDINVNIVSTNQNIKFSFKCKKSDKFKLVEQKLYEKYPNLKNEEHYYICNGIKIDNRRE